MRNEKSGSTIKERLLYYSVPEPNTGCWLWTAATFSGKYGSYGAIRVKNKLSKAHRVSYQTFVGPIPSGLSVCHRCDTPECINPDHLFVGTKKDNSLDMMKKGRHYNARR